MNNRYHVIYLSIISLLILYSFNQRTPKNSIPPDANAHQEAFYSVKTNKAFIDAVEDAAFAISERNFRITNTLRIGNAIRERGAEGYLDYDVILFCNIHYAQKMLDLNPYYVNYCPGQISISAVSADEVIITAPMIPYHESNFKLNKYVEEINNLVIESIDFAAEGWQTASE